MENIRTFLGEGKTNLMGFKSEKMSLENYITSLDEYVSTYKQCEEQKARLALLKEEEIKKFDDKLQYIAT